MTRNPILFHKRAEAVKLAQILSDRFKNAPTDAGKLIHAILVEFLHSQRGNRACNTEVCEMRLCDLRDQTLKEFRDYIVEREGTDDLALGLEQTEGFLESLDKLGAAVEKLGEVVDATASMIETDEKRAMSGWEEADALRNLDDPALQAQVQAAQTEATLTVETWGTQDAVVKTNSGNKFLITYAGRLVTALSKIYGLTVGAQAMLDAKGENLIVGPFKPLPILDMTPVSGRVFPQGVLLDKSFPPALAANLTAHFGGKTYAMMVMLDAPISRLNELDALLSGPHKATLDLENKTLTVWSGKTYTSEPVEVLALK